MKKKLLCICSVLIKLVSFLFSLLKIICFVTSVTWTLRFLDHGDFAFLPRYLLFPPKTVRIQHSRNYLVYMRFYHLPSPTTFQFMENSLFVWYYFIYLTINLRDVSVKLFIKAVLEWADLV